MTDLVAFIKARLTEDEESQWPHRLTCQMAARTPGLALSCNCDAADRWWREIQGKRRLIAAAAAYSPELEHGDNGEWAFDLVLRELAMAWSDHPDYLTEWAP
jgi:hypothetical protein